jgi:sterol desaturase/sphingolipid hydroxylase (fatty acid hydroxylase superfamily)
VWCAAVALIGLSAWLMGTGLSDLVRGQILRSDLSSAEAETVGPALLVMVVLVFAAERLWPAVPRRVTARGHIVDAGYLGVYALAAPAVTLLSTGFAIAVERYASFLRLARLPLLPQVAVVAMVLLGIDAINWAAHVANHRVGVFWRFHALHHSQEEMSVFTTFRTHPMAHASYLPAVLPALVLAANGSVPTVGLVAYGCLVTLPHANLRWNYGRVGRWVVSPAFHRLHHANTDVDGKRAVNFGFVLAVWDRLAGTAALPHGRVVMETGIGGRPVPIEQDLGRPSAGRVIISQLAQPFRLRSGLER